MSDVPYKYLKDENWDTFYPITGPSSVNGEIPVANGGTGADTAAGARANLGAVSAQDVTLASQPNDFVVTISEGGTGAQTAADARDNLGLSVQTLSPTLTKTGGTGTNISCAAWSDGRCTTINFGFETTGDTALQQYVFQGTISGVPFPHATANGLGNYTSSILVVALQSDGTLTIRVLVNALSRIQSPNRGFASITYVS